FLAAPRSGHGVQIYAQVDELAESVAEYLAAGIRTGEPALVLATPEHLAAFRERLATIGVELATVDEEGLLVLADAADTLDALLEDGLPSPTRFETVVGGLLDEAATRADGRQTRVFGELADLLCRRGEVRAATALEELWHRAARERRFALLCGYCLDVFDRETQSTTLPRVCTLHSHVLPAHRYARFARSVDRALDEELGPREAGHVYMIVGREIQEERMPAAQLILMWISANMPSRAERILASARAHYAGSPATLPAP
ncbi:MAG: MEDS domain-containing protein, partial [Gammaproteobacteria bacterium]